MKEDIQFNENDVFLCKTNEQFFINCSKKRKYFNE